MASHNATKTGNPYMIRETAEGHVLCRVSWDMYGNIVSEPDSIYPTEQEALAEIRRRTRDTNKWDMVTMEVTVPGEYLQVLSE